ncbi:XAC2610-related protein [Flavobacterium sp.]|uniref:XAC2610-related protein n=1 Tax=Flavobacterium sp. TaxID=239 RepID=UPI00286C3D30|nr:hypothetical protein [Flavobacterium sp.]
MKQIIKLVLVCFLIISCNGQVTDKNKQDIKQKKKQIENTNQEQPPVNFFDQKYFNGYMISFGDSDISEHPYRNYYNYENKEVQWFAISYVPKDISLHNYWLNYLQGSNSDETTQSSVIEKIVNKDLSLYNTFAVYIPKKYLDVSNGESEEAMFFKNNTEVYFYLYNLSEKKWEFLKKVKTNNASIGKRDFFYKEFPELFPFDKVVKLNDKKNVDEVENLTLSKNFIFRFLISKIESGDEDEKEKIKISLKNKETNKVQEIDFIPQSLVVKLDLSSSNCYSYFDLKKSIIKTTETLKNIFSLIVLDVNFDGLEDFAIINIEGSNGGPLYAYYIQKPNKQFVFDTYLTENMRFFPIEINKQEKSLSISHISGCCNIQNFKIQIQPNGEWKEIYSKLEDVK